MVFQCEYILHSERLILNSSVVDFTPNPFFKLNLTSRSLLLLNTSTSSSSHCRDKAAK